MRLDTPGSSSHEGIRSHGGIAIRKLGTNLYLALEDEDCDFSSAQYDQSLSKASYEKDVQLFWASIDYGQNKSAIALIKKILTAHGYDLNIENVLATLDSLWFGNIVQTKSDNPQPNMPARRFLPAISFYMPSKGNSGFLLELFYQELKALDDKKLVPKDKDLAKTLKENEQLLDKQKKELKELNDQIKYLEHMLAKKGEQGGGAEVQQEYHKDLDIRVGTVHRMDYDQRFLLIKSGRQHFKVPFVFLRGFPKAGDRCAIKTKAKKSGVDIIFTHDEIGSFEQYLGIVVAISPDGILKVRIDRFGYWQIKPVNEHETQLLEDLQVGQFMLLSFFEENLIRFQKIEQVKSWTKDMVTEAIASNQLLEKLNTKADDHSSSYEELKEAT
ncbi:MAG: hypothetical protein HRU09_05865 [Oligoflexales bacterium]|nr:hypothetical protein [Oligoflexales bacterium]